MRIRWFGQSAFLLSGSEGTVMLDPVGDTAAFEGRVRFDYPPVTGVSADLVLVTHDHGDHNGVAGIDGDPAVIRVAGTHASPVGEVVGVAGEHDDVAGTRRGPNTLFAFTLDGIRVAHLGDHGQSVLRPEQAVALGPIDLLFVPVGRGPTGGGRGSGRRGRRRSSSGSTRAGWCRCTTARLRSTSSSRWSRSWNASRR